MQSEGLQKFVLGTSMTMVKLYLHRTIPFKPYHIASKYFRLRMQLRFWRLGSVEIKTVPGNFDSA